MRSPAVGLLAGVALPWALCAALVPGPLLGQEAEGSVAPGENLPVERIALDNGMRFLVLERHHAPIVSFVVHYPVGSVNEHLGNTGIAHVLEHMLFKGSDEIGTTDREAESALLAAMDRVKDSLDLAHAGPAPDTASAQRFREALERLEDEARGYVIPNEFDRLLSEAGARGLNATTSHEATRYFVDLPSNRTELWFALEADRMKNPVFREFFTELDVVREERRMRLETSPAGLLESALLATAFQVHPYGVPVIGHASDLEALTREQAAEYFRTYYGGQNAVVAVVGDVDVDQIRSWAHEYFGSVPRGRPAPPVSAEEPEQRGPRHIEVEFDAEPRLMIGWKAPPGLHPDGAALSMLAAVLTGGRTTRLYRRLVTGDRLAIQVGAYLSPGFAYPQLFSISATPRSPHTTEELERAIYEEIEALKANPPDEQALTRVKNQFRAGDYRRLSQNFQLAAQLAESEAALGDWRATFRLSGRIMDVTPEDVQAAARAYLVDRTKTVATLVAKEPS